MTKINHNGVLLFIVIAIASATAFCSCERFTNPPNLEILNAHHDGQLTISYVVSGDVVYDEWSIIGNSHEIHLEQGNYRVYLDIDNQLYPDVRDLWVTVFLASEFTFCKIKLSTQ